MSQPHRWTPEEAEANATKGAVAANESRKRKAEMTPEERAKEAIKRQSEQLARELVDAALGKGDFANLAPGLRLNALTRAMEYVLGKPSTGQSIAPDKDPKPETGIEFV